MHVICTCGTKIYAPVVPCQKCVDALRNTIVKLNVKVKKLEEEKDHYNGLYIRDSERADETELKYRKLLKGIKQIKDFPMTGWEFRDAAIGMAKKAEELLLGEYMYKVIENEPNKWAIVKDDNEIIETGFFTKAAADYQCETYNEIEENELNN
jgi:hypothetical protein